MSGTFAIRYCRLFLRGCLKIDRESAKLKEWRNLSAMSMMRRGDEETASYCPRMDM